MGRKECPYEQRTSIGDQRVHRPARSDDPFICSPKRIISLVPSQTELLFDLGLEQEVVGITKFCIHPYRWFREKTKIGGTKKFWLDKINELKPDLIIGNKEENYPEGIEKLREYPVWMSEVNSFSDATEMIQGVGKITDREDQADNLIGEIARAFEGLNVRPPKSVLYLIWKDPWMAAGKNTFINSMLEKMGLVNCLMDDRYPELSIEKIKRLDPELIFLSSEPYPFKEIHKRELHGFFPSAEVHKVDGEMFSWYGSRLREAPRYFNGLTL